MPPLHEVSLFPACFGGVCSILGFAALVSRPGLSMRSSHVSLLLCGLQGKTGALPLLVSGSPCSPWLRAPPQPHPRSPAPSPLLHCRYNLDPFGSHTDETLWQVLERTFMRDTVGLWGCSECVVFPADTWLCTWPGLFMDTACIHTHSTQYLLYSL